MIEYKPRSAEILNAVSEAYNIPVDTLRGRGKMSSISRARQTAFALLRESLGWSYPRIAMMFNRDHTTVLHGVRSHEALIDKDADYRSFYHGLSIRFGGSEANYIVSWLRENGYSRAAIEVENGELGNDDSLSRRSNNATVSSL